MTQTIRNAVSRLETFSAITNLTDERIYDSDPRRAGRGAKPAMFSDVNSELLPTIALDDVGSIPTLRSGSFLSTEQIFVWIFCPKTPNGRSAMEALRNETIRVLNRWYDSDTGAIFTFGGRIGEALTESPADSLIERLTFRVSASTPGEW